MDLIFLETKIKYNRNKNFYTTTTTTITTNIFKGYLQFKLVKKRLIKYFNLFI